MDRVTISDCLNTHAVQFPGKPAFIFLEDGEAQESKYTFSQLAHRVHQIATYLQEKGLQGERVILLYADSVDFVFAFLACQYAGAVAVPVHFSKGKKQMERITTIMDDARPACILSTQATQQYLESSGLSLLSDRQVGVLATDDLENEPAQMEPVSNWEEVAFIQYTSGSTSAPKGVVVTAKALISNQEAIQDTFECHSGSHIFSWLPFQHDMGLIGNILHAVYVGCTCVLMSPHHFMQKPARWLQAISKYKITHSGGPNFAYGICVDKIDNVDEAWIDLSSWEVAFCGAEPVHSKTMEQFVEKFGSLGFCPDNFYPCYGLAEATLLVSGVKNAAPPKVVHTHMGQVEGGGIVLVESPGVNTKPVVSCGAVAKGLQVKIVKEGQSQFASEGVHEGEVCISGDSVTDGYWNKDNAELFHEIDGIKYLRTGDLGFIYNEELFIYGRAKELLISRGKNYYPNDIERLVYPCDEAILGTGVAVFSMSPGTEAVVVVVEIKREFIKTVDAYGLIVKVSSIVKGVLGQEPYDVVLVTPLSIPRTTSGKLKRLETQRRYARHGFNPVATKSVLAAAPRLQSKDNKTLIDQVMERGDYGSVKDYLVNIIEQKTGVCYEGQNDKVELTSLGIDSLRSMEMINIINADLALNLNAAKISQLGTLSDLIRTIENMIWLKKGEPSDQTLFL